LISGARYTAAENTRPINALPIDAADYEAERAPLYYAAFHAVTALFALEGKSFSKHTAVRAAVHGELVKTGRWPVELGASYNDLMSARHTGDYGGVNHVSKS